ncbi:MAG: TonB-dependent receptor plug domain-containing protein, partial [Longimicrobiales bacterium]
MRTQPYVRVGLALVAGCLISLSASEVAAQTGTVTGRVTASTTGAPLDGVVVTVQGSSLQTFTNQQGRYLLTNAPAGTVTLEATRLGYSPVTLEVTVTAGETVVANLEMNDLAISMDELVVTGTAGSARRKEIGNSIGVISSDDLDAIAVTSATDILQGQAPGLVIRQTGGAVGNGSEIMLRGVNTLGGPNSNRPLIYVDGVRIENGSHQSADEASAQATVFDDIDANSIERVEVIKGAAATTLYGTEAAAGVIQIFTKGGGGGAPQWTASISQGFSEVGHVGPEEDPTGLQVNDCTADPTCPSSGTWLQRGYIQEYDLSVRGGETVPWYFAASFADQEGNIDPQG